MAFSLRAAVNSKLTTSTGPLKPWHWEASRIPSQHTTVRMLYWVSARALQQYLTGERRPVQRNCCCTTTCSCSGANLSADTGRGLGHFLALQCSRADVSCVNPASWESCSFSWGWILDGSRSGLQQESSGFCRLSECLGTAAGFSEQGNWFCRAGALVCCCWVCFFFKFETNLWKWMYCYQENKAFFSLRADMFSEVD